MKKIIFLSVVITTLFFGLITNAGNPAGQSMAYIHYQVHIQNNIPAGTTLCPMSVFITDGQDRLIGNSLPYRPYISNYDFYELGPVKGTRISHLEILPVGADIFCPLTPLPSQKSGEFFNGATYPYFMILGHHLPTPLPLPAAEN